MSFLERIVDDLLSKNQDLSQYTIVLPGKRPVVFFRRILSDRIYSGLLPDFLTVEELIKKIAAKQLVQGIALWLFSFEVYRNLFPDEEFSEFLKWFPTVQKDWDDMLKFSDSDVQVLAHMLDEERIKNWAENLGEEEDNPRKRFLNFWKKMNLFLPTLKEKLAEKNWATSGMLHENAKNKIEHFAVETNDYFVFCGFNAFTPIEEKLVKILLQRDKALCFFQGDSYYVLDEKQEAGKFLRQHKTWKEFNNNRPFNWIDSDFEKSKKIKVFEVSGNISQTKVLPEIFKSIEDEDFSNTAVILLDENLLPASLDALGSVENLNITMGFPLRNLGFSNAVKQLFYIQKQLEKGNSSYYYHDVLSVLESLPNFDEDQKVVEDFSRIIQERNMVYLSSKRLQELLGNLSYFNLFIRNSDVRNYLQQLIEFCFSLKFRGLDDIQFENVSHFERSFKIILNQLSSYSFPMKMETLEVLINQLVSSETIDFQGEPLQGLQIMGLLETRLLNFKNVIMLSVNEGKLPLGNSQNTYIPFDIRKNFNMHTFLENDSIYAYHFYRLLQDSENVFLLYNSLTTGVNTGEKSRFIAQLEMESPHEIQQIIIENTSEPISGEPMIFEKTAAVNELFQDWKKRVSASHLTSYLYDPAQFYLNYLLKTKEADEIEEELSVRNYGNLVHYSLQFLFEKVRGKQLSANDLEILLQQVDESIEHSIVKLNHQPEFYSRGMNFVHKSIAKRVIESMLKYDLELVKKGHSLEIVDLERKFEDLEFFLNDEKTDSVKFHGFIDRIDKLDGKLRVIDYKTAKAKNLKINFSSKNNIDRRDVLLMDEKYKQALQLCIYLYYIKNNEDLKNLYTEAGIWSFAEVKSGVQKLEFSDGNLDAAMISIKNLILEILNPEIPFEEKTKPEYGY